MASRVELHHTLKQKAASPDGPGLPVKIHTDLGVDSVDCETASLTLSDGTIVTGDLVVGADGVHSKTRRSVVGRDVPLISSGQACYRWLVPNSLLTEDPATKVIVDQPRLFVQVAGPDKHLVFYPLGSAAVTNSVLFVPRDAVGEIKRGAPVDDKPLSFAYMLIAGRLRPRRRDRTGPGSQQGAAVKPQRNLPDAVPAYAGKGAFRKHRIVGPA